MTASLLNGNRVTSARVSIPAWGCWYADVSLDVEVPLTGPVTLTIADLTLRGTVLSGGITKGRSDYRIVGGAGGWGKTIPETSYANDAGVKVVKVLEDAAALVGEKMGPIDSSLRVGPAYVRNEARASRSLEVLAPSGWYVDELGVTQIGKRPAIPLPGAVTHGPVDRARGTVTIASESIAAILPGITVDGLVAVDVAHEITPDGGLRSTIWGPLSSDSASRPLDAMRAVFEQLDPDRKFRGVTEYRVVTLSGKRVNLQPVRVSSGMPDLANVLARPGVPGCDADVALGCRVLVGFADSDRARPYVAAFEDAEGAGFVPTILNINAALIKIGAGARPAIAAGDLAGIFPCIPTQVQVLI